MRNSDALRSPLSGIFALAKRGREVFDQVAERPLDLALVDRAVGLEPFLGLVEGERLEERHRLRAETSKGHAKTSLSGESAARRS